MAQKIFKKLLASEQKLGEFKGRKIFAREPLAKLQRNFASINRRQDFAQNGFGLRPTNTTILN